MSAPKTLFHHASSALLDGIEDQFVPAVDEYLALYIDPESLGDRRCPECGTGSFTWGIAWGAGHCYACHWPGRLYHVISDSREEDSLVCSATCNGYRVCEATRGEHVPHEVHWISDKGETGTDIELRCPEPTVPPGVSRPFISRYKPPEIARFNLLLWAHPDFVEARRGN